MAWGSLNPSLTAFRNAINKRFPNRSMKSDGGVADKNHSSTSKHQLDENGWANAFDCDNNFLNSSDSHGSPEEDKILEAIKLDFEQDPHKRAHLWISHREIAQHNSGNWKENYYGGDSAHDEHTHFETCSDKKNDSREWPMPHLDEILGDNMGMELTDKYKPSPDACAALDKPEGYEVTVKSGFDHMLICGGRSLDKLDEMKKRLADMETANASMAAKIEEILGLLKP